MSLLKDENKLLIHYFWTGSLPPIAVRRSIANMKNVIKLSNSNSEVCLWVRKEDTLNNSVFRQKLCLECLVENRTLNLEYYNLAAMDGDEKYQNIKVIIIDVLLDYYKKQFPKIIDVFKKMLEYKAYPFASDLARCFILNIFPGIYLDCDTETIKNTHFIKNFNELKNLFLHNHYSLKNYYMALFGKKGLLENQIIISFEKACFQSCFEVYNALLSEEHYLEKTFEDLEDYKNNWNKKIVKALNNSVFNSNEHFPYMKYYAKNDFDQFKKLNERSGVSFSYAVLDFFFEIICNCFYYKNSIEYAVFFNAKIGKYFKLLNQDSLIYSWKNPGYSRLNKLKEVVNLINKKIILKNKKQQLQLLSSPVTASYLPMQTEQRRVTASYLPMQTEQRRVTASYLPMQTKQPQVTASYLQMDQKVLPHNQGIQNPSLQNFVNKALQQVNDGYTLNQQDINKILKLSPLWQPLMLPLEESKDGIFNFSQPIRLDILKIKQQKQYHYFRYIINESGEIILGFDDEILKLKNGGYQNLTKDGYAIASHASLNNYQPVIAAGQVYYDHKTNNFTKINNKSGHYRPNSLSLEVAIILFKNYFPNNTNKLKAFLFNQG